MVLMNDLPILYRENPDLRLTATYLDEQTYSQALDAFIVVCADVIFINRDEQLLYLAKRRVKPQNDWYMFGGRIKRGERELEAAQHNLARETGLKLDPDRFEYFGLRRFWWQERQQAPQTNGVDALIFIFLVEPTANELAQATEMLDREEYEQDLGIVGFNRQQLVENKAHEVLLEIYDALFG